MNENSIHLLINEREDQLAQQLRALAEVTHPQPEYVTRLSAELLAQWEPTSAQERPHGNSRPTHLWRQPVFKQLSLALAGTTAVALMIIFVLPILLGHGNLPSLPLLSGQPVLADEWSPQRPFGPLGDVELMLETELPDGPDKAPVYRLAVDTLPSTPEEALAWAERFGLPDPQVYRYCDARDPNFLIIIASDGQTLTFNANAPASVTYGRGIDLPLQWQAGDPNAPPPLSFEVARDIAVAFLQAHDLLPEAYRVEEERWTTPPPWVESPPIRHVLIQPQLDGYPIEGHSTEISVMVGPNGKVYSVWLSPLTFTQSKAYPLKSAAEAFEALRSGDIKGPFRLSIDWHATTDATASATAAGPQTTYYRPEPATYRAGDAVTVRGYVQLLRAVETGEIQATLSNHDRTFELSGSALNEMAEMAADLGHGETAVQGTIEAKLGPRRWRLAVTNWAVEALRQIERLTGTVAVEDGTVFLVADDGTHYRLRDLPEELSAGDRIAIYAEVLPAEGDEPPTLRWFSIESPSAARQHVSGSSECVSVAVKKVPAEKEVIEAAPGPAPVTRTVIGALYFEDDRPVLETPEGQRLHIVGLPEELNDGHDGRVIAVRGQVPPPVEEGDLPTITWQAEEPVSEPGELHQESVSTQVEVAPPANYEPPSSPYQIGDEVELEGKVGATIYVDGDEHRVEAWFGSGLGPDYDLTYRLTGSPDLLEELASHDQLHLRLRARIVYDERSPLSQALEATHFEKIWPDEQVQGFLGTITVEMLDGREVAIFTDKESKQRYVLFRSLSSDFSLYSRDYMRDMSACKQVFLAGVVRPDQAFAGLPVIDEGRMRTGGPVDAATSADQLPLEHPQVVDETGIRLKGLAIIDRVELSYYAPPGALGERPNGEVTPEFSLVQPVWVFHGHTEDGRATFRAYVQAVADDYIAGQ